VPLVVAAAMPLQFWQLERAVADNPADDAFVQEEREAILFHLRSFVGADGVVPPRFSGLVEETFADLL
jgi:hypothetical protein